MSDDVRLPLDLARLREVLDGDPEFTLQARHLTTTLRFIIGETQQFLLKITDGRVTEIDPLVTPLDGFDIQVTGSEEQWSALLAATPAPFYQDFFPAMLHHGFRIAPILEKAAAR